MTYVLLGIDALAIPLIFLAALTAWTARWTNRGARAFLMTVVLLTTADHLRGGTVLLLSSRALASITALIATLTGAEKNSRLSATR